MITKEQCKAARAVSESETGRACGGFAGSSNKNAITHFDKRTVPARRADNMVKIRSAL